MSRAKFDVQLDGLSFLGGRKVYEIQSSIRQPNQHHWKRRYKKTKEIARAFSSPQITFVHCLRNLYFGFGFLRYRYPKEQFSRHREKRSCTANVDSVHSRNPVLFSGGKWNASGKQIYPGSKTWCKSCEEQENGTLNFPPRWEPYMQGVEGPF